MMEFKNQEEFIMAGSFPDSVNPGLFLPTTPMFDVGELNEDNLKQLVVQLTQSVNNICNTVNLKDTGMYPLQQLINGQTFFPDPALNSGTAQTPTQRQVFRQVFLTGPLPNAGVLLVPHNIAPTALFTFTRIYGTASDTTGFNYIPLPQAFIGGNIVDLSVDAVNIIIRTNFNATNYNVVYIVLEWLKN